MSTDLELLPPKGRHWALEYTQVLPEEKLTHDSTFKGWGIPSIPQQLPLKEPFPRNA